MKKNLGKRSIVWGALIASVALLAPLSRSGGVPQVSQAAAIRADQTSMYQMILVDRTVKAVKYAHRSGSTKIDFEGTDLMAGAKGEAKVDSHRGAMEIKVEFSNMQKPTTFGGEYLTYVMWAISPEGRPVNLGEVLIGNNDRSKLERHDGPSSVRHDRDRGTLLRGAASQQRSRNGKCNSSGHRRHHRSGGCEI